MSENTSLGQPVEGPRLPNPESKGEKPLTGKERLTKLLEKEKPRGPKIRAVNDFASGVNALIYEGMSRKRG